MTTPPRIGITTYGRNEAHHFTLPAAYVDSIRRAGGVPLLIPPGEPNLIPFLSLFDGLILAGGGDIDPACYNGQNHPAVYRIDAERDRTEIPLARALAEGPWPALCICRGIQVLNVALGGTLIEDIPDLVGEEIAHRTPLNSPNENPYSKSTRHPVTVEADSRLGRIFARTEVDTVSWHHQALRDLAPGLRVVARAADGIIEAVELPDHPWLVAVQWHPELSAADDPRQQSLFDAFVAAARRYAESG